jgi:hypothetical protein
VQAASKLDDLLVVRKELDTEVAEKDALLAAQTTELQTVKSEVDAAPPPPPSPPPPAWLLPFRFYSQYSMVSRPVTLL